MRGRKKVWLAGAGLALGMAGAIFIADNILSRRVEPYIRQQAVEYLRQRFDSEVELSTFRVRLPKTTLLRLILARGRRGIALVEGENLVLRHKGRRDIPPLFRMRHFSFEVDLDKLLARQKSVPLVEIDGLELTIPAKRDHPRVLPEARRQVTSDQGPPVQIDSVLITHGLLVILPKDSKKVPLRFDIHRVQLNAASGGMAMTYSAALTNPRPPGEIISQGASALGWLTNLEIRRLPAPTLWTKQTLGSLPESPAFCGRRAPSKARSIRSRFEEKRVFPTFD